MSSRNPVEEVQLQTQTPNSKLLTPTPNWTGDTITGLKLTLLFSFHHISSELFFSLFYQYHWAQQQILLDLLCGVCLDPSCGISTSTDVLIPAHKGY